MTINVEASAAPTISTPGAAVNYTENDPATVIDATATVSDVDSANFDLGTLSVSFSSGGTANDGLSVLPGGNVTLDTTAVTDAVSTDQDVAVVISKATLLANDTDPEGDTLTLTSFTQPTNGAVVDDGEGSLTYTPDSLYTGVDSFTYTAVDGNGGTNIGTVNVFVGNPPNIAPALTTPGSAVNYTENDPATIIDATVTIIDVDSYDFFGGTLTVSFSASGTANDELSILPGGTVTLDGMDVKVSTVVIGSVAGGSGGTPLVIYWNAFATQTAAQDLIS